MLRAARTRTIRSSEVINVGDCVWLIVRAQVVQAVLQQLRKRVQKQHCEPQMLCKVARIKRVVTRTPGDEHAVYLLLAISGVIGTYFTIDELQRCAIPPRDHPVSTKAVPSDERMDAAGGRGRGKRLTLPEAYKNNVNWLFTRHAVELKNSATARRARPDSGSLSQPLPGTDAASPRGAYDGCSECIHRR